MFLCLLLAQLVHISSASRLEERFEFQKRQAPSSTIGYAILSPSSCPPSTPSGSLIGQSNDAFSEANEGLQYLQYPNSQFILQDNSSGPFFVDLSSSSSVAISDTAGNTLMIYANGTFQVFVGFCQLEIVGSWLASDSSGNRKRMASLERRRSWSEFTHEVETSICSHIEAFCQSSIGNVITSYEAKSLCNRISVGVGEIAGGAAGSLLDEVLGPGGTWGGAELGEELGALLAPWICQKILKWLYQKLCQECKYFLSSSMPSISSTLASDFVSQSLALTLTQTNFSIGFISSSIQSMPTFPFQTSSATSSAIPTPVSFSSSDLVNSQVSGGSPTLLSSSGVLMSPDPTVSRTSLSAISIVTSITSTICSVPASNSVPR